MKILQFLLPVGLGGVERIASMLHNFGNENGNTMALAIGKSFASQMLEKFEIKDRKNIFIINDTNFFKTFIDLKKAIVHFKPDIVHTHARRECFLVCLANFRGINTRTQHMAENPHIKVTNFEKILLKHNVKCWFATSYQLADCYLRRLGYLDSDKIDVIYNGIDLSLPRIHSGRRYRFCMISRLSFQKGIDILLEQIYHMPVAIQDKIRVDFWGEGPEKNKLLNLISEYHLEKNVCYKGVTYTPKDKLINYDALLMPSRYEGLPLTMLESMACKTPVAIHDVGCINEFIHNGVNGWIINDQYTWKDFFSNLHDKNYPWEKISQEAYQTYQNSFQGKIMCQNYFKHFSSLAM